MNSEVLNRFIEKYGEIEGPRKYRWANTSLESFILRYGKELGEQRYKLYCKKMSNTLKNIPEERKFEIRKRKSEKNRVRKITWHSSLEDFIKKYGETLGREKYNSWLEKVRKNTPRGPQVQKRQKYINSVNWYIDKYGEKEGIIHYNNWKKSQDHSSLDFLFVNTAKKKGRKNTKK